MSGSVWNFGNASQDIYYDGEILKKMAPHLPRLKKVIVTISYFSLRYSLSNSDEKWREALYYHQWGIPSRLKDADPRRYDLAATAGHRLQNTPNASDPVYRGWRPLDNVLDPELCGLIMERHAKGMHADDVPINVAILKKVALFCSEKGIRLFFVTTPHHVRYRNLIDPVILQADEREIRSLATPYLNYFDDDRFLDGEFADVDHLNKGGAMHFSRILSKALNAVDEAHPNYAPSGQSPCCFVPWSPG
jgi:hypothetical protein